MKSEKSDGPRSYLARSVPSDLKSVPFSHPTKAIQADTPFRSVHTIQLGELAKALKLPVNRITLSALRFALQFHLPLNNETLEPLIKQSIKIPPPFQEAGLFSAILAFSKGLRLSDRTLAHIAPMFTPYRNFETRRKGEHNLGPAQHQSKKPGEDLQDEIEMQDSRADTSIPIDILKTVSVLNQFTTKYPAFDILNRFADKNKQRLIIIPFHFLENFFTLRGNLRLHCIDRPGGTLEVTLLALEGATQEHQWYVQASKTKAGGLAITINVYPPPKDPQGLVNSLSSISDTVTFNTKKPDSFPEFREESYISFEIKA